LRQLFHRRPLAGFGLVIVNDNPSHREKWVATRFMIAQWPRDAAVSSANEYHASLRRFSRGISRFEALSPDPHLALALL